MAFITDQRNYLESVLKDCVRNKFLTYSPKIYKMPFHENLLGKDRVALFSCTHFLNSRFNEDIFKPIAKAIGKINFKVSEIDQVIETIISSKAMVVIDDILNKLEKTSSPPSKKQEIELIRKCCKEGKAITLKLIPVDLKLITHEDKVYLIHLKGIKQNIDNFLNCKRTLLELVAVTLYEDQEADINSLLAIPYNSYEPEPYEPLWRIKGLIDIDEEIKVGKSFWDFLGGEGTYEILLDIFEKVGIELKPEIDEYFNRFNLKQE